MRYSLFALVGCFLLAAAVLSFVIFNGTRNAGIVAEALARIDDPYLLDLEGNHFDPYEGNTDHILVAVFTRSDCPISNRYAPEIRRLHEEFSPRGANFYLIYVDPREQPDTIRAHLAEYDYPCTALRDPDFTFVAATGATVTPEAVVLDQKRNVIYRGRIDDQYADLGQARPQPTRHDLADAIEATLAGLPVAEPITAAVGCRIEDLK